MDIDHQLLGKIGACAIALTPGGRFPEDCADSACMATNGIVAQARRNYFLDGRYQRVLFKNSPAGEYPIIFELTRQAAGEISRESDHECAAQNCAVPR
jgi:hypothetical protein